MYFSISQQQLTAANTYSLLALFVVTLVFLGKTLGQKKQQNLHR